MNTQTPARTHAPAALLAAQREVRADLAELAREAVCLPTRDWNLWCDAVHLRLRLLRAHLKSRFELEDSAGSLLLRLDGLAMDAALHLEPPLWAGALRELLTDIVLHEERENELLLRVPDQTTGASA